jgi:hypothetical protein
LKLSYKPIWALFSLSYQYSILLLL